MSVHVYYSCKQCSAEIEVSVTINEEDDLPEKCEECGQPIPDAAHEEVQQSALDKVRDSADLWDYD